MDVQAWGRRVFSSMFSFIFLSSNLAVVLPEKIIQQNELKDSQGDWPAVAGKYNAR